MEEFVRRHRQIDDDVEFNQLQQYCLLKLTVLKEELGRHKRNIQQ